MTWHCDQLDQIAGSAELQITTARTDGSRRRWTPIWVVRVGDSLYIRSAGGPSSGWYRHATQHNTARIKAGGIETDVTLQPAREQALNAEVDAAYRAKYGNQSSWVSMFFRAPATETTLRLEN